VVDLGGPRTLSGLGVTLGSTASPATVSIDLAIAAGSWHPVASARSIALRGNTPSYVPLPERQIARYARLTVTTGDGTPACVGDFRLFADTNAGTDMMLGADLSFTAQELTAGTTFTDQGRVATPVQILRSHGGNYVRMRLWVNPPAGYSDLASDLTLAHAVRAAGMKLYLDIHYSDFWADPQHQITPAAWQGQDLSTLANTVRSYTHNLATLLKAGIQGARSANPAGHPLRVMLHYDQGGNNATSVQFFQNLISRDVRFDVIGLSYYTFFHGPVTALRDNVDKLAAQFGKDIVMPVARPAGPARRRSRLRSPGPSADGCGDFVCGMDQASTAQILCLT
jgi:arabinogalactan endo-1,4-beta-galactosidase